MENTIEESLKQAERLRQSILKRAFEGKLVPQDLNDEPAGGAAGADKRREGAKGKSKSKKKSKTYNGIKHFHSAYQKKI